MSNITFKQVFKQYPKAATHTINNVNLTIEQGEFCVFVGPSGCGKSTLLRMVAGLEDISGGELSIDHKVVNDVPPAERGVAMVFQSYALYPHMTVEENMGFGLKVLGSDKEAIKTKVAKAAESLQLSHLLDRFPRELSGGQRQRVAIGRAIVKEPKVFLFDEPLSNLDAALRVQTRLEIARLHKQIKTASMIYVTHDQVEAMTLADKIVLLHSGNLMQERGSIAQVGSPLTLYHRPNSRFVAEFIGSPKMNVLPATLQLGTANGVQVKIGDMLLDAKVDGSALAANSELNIGIRPEHIKVLAANDNVTNNQLSGQVLYIEKLGDASLIYVELGAGLPTITVCQEDTTSLQVGDTIRLLAPAEQMHVFDQQDMACHRLGDFPK